jgi:hypothetical protein
MIEDVFAILVLEMFIKLDRRAVVVHGATQALLAHLNRLAL